MSTPVFNKILRELHTPELPNYQFLSSQSALQYFEAALNALLQQAENTFAEILQTVPADRNFTSIAERYLNHDEQLCMLHTLLHTLDGVCSSEQTRQIIENFQPKLTAYHNKVSLSSEYYTLISALQNSDTSLCVAQKKSIELLVRNMQIAGVHLPAEKKQQLEQINQKLTQLSDKFSNNVLDSRKEFFRHFEDKKSLEEIPDQDLKTAQQEAQKRQLSGYVFTLSQPSYQAIMTYCTRSSIRQEFWEANVSVASSGPYDNRPLIVQILQLRHQKAQLLGYPNYAAYILQERMATDEQEVLTTLEEFGNKARIKAEQDIKRLQQFANTTPLQPWDVSYYAEKLKKQKFQLDQKELKNYFPLEQTLQGLFGVAQKLFGLTFEQISTASYHPNVCTYKVYLGEKLIAYFLFDLFARAEKNGGAWCNCFRGRRKTTNQQYQIPIILNACNFGKNSEGETLLTHSEVQTLFHEFGHGLHLVLSENEYLNLSGFHTEWDFVELPSQLLENWTWHEESLSTFAKHIHTKKLLPQSMLQSLQTSRTFLSGYFAMRQNEFGMLDFILHTSEPPQTVEELDHTCDEIVSKYRLFPKSKKYKMYASFSHIFAGGYAAGYYSYLWAEILEADVFAQFEAAGVLDAKMGERYRQTILAPGSSLSGTELFANFMGRTPQIGALLKKLGL